MLRAKSYAKIVKQNRLCLAPCTHYNADTNISLSLAITFSTKIITQQEMNDRHVLIKQSPQSNRDSKHHYVMFHFPKCNARELEVLLKYFGQLKRVELKENQK